MTTDQPARHITVYGPATGCQPCRATKRMLDKLGIEYDEVDTSRASSATIAFLQGLGHTASPVVVVMDDRLDWAIDHFSGYRPDKLQRLAS